MFFKRGFRSPDDILPLSRARRVSSFFKPAHTAAAAPHERAHGGTPASVARSLNHNTISSHLWLH